MKKITAAKYGKLISVDLEAGFTVLERIRIIIDWDKEFTLSDIKDHISKNPNTLSKNLKMLFERGYLKSRLEKHKRYYIMPIHTNTGKNSKAREYFLHKNNF